MATAATLLESKGGDARVFSVVIDSADTTGSFAHTLPFTPDYVMITPMSAGCYSQSLLYVSTTATLVNFSKGGAAAATFLCMVGRSYHPNS